MSNAISIVNKEDHQDMFTMMCYCVIPFETSCSKYNLSSDVKKPNFVATKKVRMPTRKCCMSNCAIYLRQLLSLIL